MLSEKRILRLRREIDWIIKLPAAGRKELLSLLSEKEGVEYETVKRDLYALAYAVLSGGSIPRSYEEDVKALKKALDAGKLDKEKCESAALIFLEHDPGFDFSRLGITGVYDPELDEVKSLVIEYAEKTASLKAARLGWHPARQKAELWRIIGAKIYSELPKAVEGARPEDVQIAVKRVWEENLVRMQAIWHYELALQSLKKLAEHAGWKEIQKAVEEDEISLDATTVNWVAEHAPKDPEATKYLARFLEQAKAGRKIFAGKAK